MNSMQRCLRLLLSFAGIALMLGDEINARELRSPLALQWGYGFMHYPLPRPKDYDYCGWNVDGWAAAYDRFADSAFLNKNTTQTEPLAGIFFNLPDFTGIQAFASGSVDPTNPFLQFATISPRFDYDEKGVYFGVTVDRAFGCDDSWHVGVRANIPFKFVKTELDSCCQLVAETSIADVCHVEDENVLPPNSNTVPQTIQDSYAYRLDFLSSLFLTANAPLEPLVKYHNPVNDDITINDIRVSDFNNNPIHVIARDNGTVPPPPFALRRNTLVGGPSVDTLPFVAADGSGVPNDTRARFSQNIDYTPLSSNIANQSRLWVVPTAVDNFGTLELDPNAVSIGNTIASITPKINTSVVDFFLANGVTFNTQRSIGVGDTTIELFVNRYWCDYFGEFFIGAMLPSGKRLKNPGLLLKQLTGNNGHYVFQAGGYFGWNRYDWLGIKVDAMYSYAAPRTEKVAAAFKGATVKNIGPAVDAKVSWQYFVADLDVTFMIPCNPCVGIDLGYEFYTKGKDHVSFAQTTATDFFGVVQPLDASVIEERTKIISHKARVEIFHQATNWQLFAGWMHAFAGKNAIKETDIHLGFIVYF